MAGTEQQPVCEKHRSSTCIVNRTTELLFKRKTTYKISLVRLRDLTPNESPSCSRVRLASYRLLLVPEFSDRLVIVRFTKQVPKSYRTKMSAST
jgi:hypothetical protein